ncbi:MULTISPECIES: flagellar hook-basal body complex protein FliE [Stutzerimonas]|jgi:flagellar hook-basal body complex protein FliE|uniref:Flagellar hook-basal body complex protein FliE n=1 Tax=Stutzerimonas frequens TaxID=2968969 RepID=A0AA47HZ06_9GAMM|nr:MULTISPECIES: flagellar hook-basal body complex protein FliE [Stutzerimonas]MCD1641079.1 flagellar hook-basal body complex protein FliE [Stutzerimonas stutzeri]MCX4195363.1 flagellar hook-basal body complex protein FliE [Methylobacterium organophilum]HAO76647.1 flagellar hook-basal body complex protein FliE [Pseudomonas sp.]AWT12015.1 flagellar hook-basal body complex protein FliE [Stutzerimonas frequens]MBK3918867.1 flagellar hook-basal body complex protein FliE [Stutzerimonas frequens]
MSSINQVQQDLLSRMQQLAEVAGSPAIKPASQPAADAGGLFMAAMRSVDAQQHQASAAVAAVDSGKSDDLVGAMIDSQKASVSFSALLQVRNKLTTAFDDVMRMPL